MALRAARNAGIYVPPEKIDRAIDYVKKCQNPDGGFKYILAPAGRSHFHARRRPSWPSSVGLKEIDEGPEVRRGPGLPDGVTPEHGVERRESYFFYGHYYAVQAMWQAGGDSWGRWYPAIRDELLQRQDQASGAWADPSVSNEFATAMACLILQMPNNCIPIFQR